MITDDGSPIRRIMVYGVTGSGKTTLARRIAETTGLPWHAVDDLTWQRDWIPVPGEEQRRRIGELCAEESWILDHGYGQWLDLVLDRVQLIVALDYPRLLSLSRLVRRCVINIVARRPTCNGNRETWRKLFAPDSILRWHFRSFSNKRARVRGWAADPRGLDAGRADRIRVIVLRNLTETEHWLQTLASSPPQAHR